MSYDDPFDNIPDENVKEVPVVEETVVADLEGGELSVTFKGPGGYSDRWVVVRYQTPEATLAAIKNPAFKELLDYSWKISQYDAQREGSKPAPAPQQQSRAPHGAQEAPNGEKRFCSHGEMVFKSGISAKGNSYKLFSCTAPRDQQCKAEYLK